MKATVLNQYTCGECGCVLVNEKLKVDEKTEIIAYCGQPLCPEYMVKYRLPRVELEIIPD